MIIFIESQILCYKYSINTQFVNYNTTREKIFPEIMTESAYSSIV